MDRHLNLKSNFLLLVSILLFISGCGRDEQKKNYVAKVNNSYLTEEELTAISGANGGQKFFKEEIIHNWVDRELLYQLAKKEGIIETAEFKRILNSSEKELAAAMLLEKLYAENVPAFKPEELKSYFEENKDLFRTTQPSYILNTSEFSDENKAIKFRTAAVESDWSKALNFFNNDPALVKHEFNKLYYAYDLQPQGLTRLAGELESGEVSLIIPADKNFVVIELISRLESGTIPPYDVIKDRIENRFVAVKRSEFLKNFFRELYSSNEIDVKQ